MDPIVLAVASRYKKLAFTKTLDAAWVDKMRSDFLVLMKNLPRIKDYTLGAKLREAFKFYKENFDSMIREVLTNPSSGKLPATLQLASEAAWNFSSELALPLDPPMGPFSEESQFNEFLRTKDVWERKVKDKAQKCWKRLRDAISVMEDSLSVEAPDEQRLVLEGFQVIMVGFDPSSDHKAREFEKFREVLKVYRSRSSKVAPWILRNQLPIKLDFGCKLGLGGNNSNGLITFCSSSLAIGSVVEGVKILAHEMGHQLYKHLSAGAVEFWETAITQDYGTLDLQELLQVWPENLKYPDEFVSMMATKEPVLALQVDVLSLNAQNPRASIGTRGEFQSLLDSGSKVLGVPKHPITAYGRKNPEEGFCEALGMLVAYGPATVFEQVRHWLSIAIPGVVKLSSDPRMAVRKAMRVPANPHEHYLVRCSTCCAVLNQCRCTGPKTEISTICDSCKGQATGPV